MDNGDDFTFSQVAAPSAKDESEINNLSLDIGGITINDESSKGKTKDGLNGQSNKRRISLNEVKQHHSEGSKWTVLKGRVYNLSPYMKIHPGGVKMLMKAVGKDCTSLFNKYHPWVNYEFFLEKYLVGILDDGQ